MNWNNFKHITGYSIGRCTCTRDICDEWNFELEAEFALRTPEIFKVFGKTYAIDRVIAKTNYFSMFDAATVVPDVALFIPKTADGDEMNCIPVPLYIMKEIADIFKHLEDKDAKELNGCFVSDEIYSYIDSQKEAGK